MPTTITLAEFRGTQGISAKNQVLNDQTDANEKAGRILAAANNPINEVRLTFRGNYLGAFDIVPSLGWYTWGIADNALKRGLSLNGKKLICRQVSHQIDVENGTLQTSAIFEVEAIGPDGIPGNYPTTYPTQTANPPAPEWEEPFSPGPPVELWLGTVGGISVCPLTSNTALLCLQDEADSFKIKAIVLDASTGALVAGATNTVISTTAGGFQIVRASDTTALLVYEDVADSSKGKARVLTVSGETVTPNTAAIFSNEAHGPTVDRWGTSSQYITCYRGVSGGEACVLAVSGTGVVAFTAGIGTWSAFGGDTIIRGVSCHTGLGAACCVFYDSLGNGVWGVVLNDAGGTLTPSAEQDLSFDNTVAHSGGPHNLASTSTGKVICTNYDSGGYTRVLSISGDVITAGSAETGGGFAVTKVSSSLVLAGYPSPTSTDPANVQTFTISGSTVTADANEAEVDADDIDQVDVCYLSGGYGVLIYREDVSNDAYAVLVAGEPL